MRIDPRSLIVRLGRDIGAVVGERLLGLYVHGSWVLGDLQDGRSDVDLLAVVADDPSDLLEPLRAMHERLTADDPAWTDRVEVEYASTSALAGFRDDPRPMLRIGAQAYAVLTLCRDLVRFAAEARSRTSTTLSGGGRGASRGRSCRG